MAREGAVLTVAQQGIYRQINLITGNVLTLVDCGVPRPIVKWIQPDTVRGVCRPLFVALRSPFAVFVYFFTFSQQQS